MALLCKGALELFSDKGIVASSCGQSQGDCGWAFMRLLGPVEMAQEALGPPGRQLWDWLS